MYTLPMTLALLEEYVKQNNLLCNTNFLPYIFHAYNRSILEEAPNEPVDVAGATLYIWNTNRTLKLLKKIKEDNPSSIIAVGGGSAPYFDPKTEEFLRQHPYIDLIIHKEGEVPFEQLLLHKKGIIDKGEISSSSFIENGKYYRTPLTSFIDLDTPSPYQNKNFLATLDEVDKLGLTRGTVWETNRGCPYSCTYCDWGGLVQQKIRQVPDSRIYSEIEWLVQNMDEVFFGDANFGIFKRDLEITEKIVQLYETLDNPRLKVLHTGNAKNTTDRVYAIGKLLNKYNLQRSGVSISLQSYTDEALKNVKRSNIKKEVYQNLTKKFISDGVPVYTDVIINLPGETVETFKDSLEIILEGEVVDIRNFLLEVYPNSELSQDKEKFKIKSVFNLMHQGTVKDEDEYTEQVIETYSMSSAEVKKVRNYTVMLDVFHQGKYLYFISKYLKKEHGIRFVDFYMDLFEYENTFIKQFVDQRVALEKFNEGKVTKSGKNPPFNINWGVTFRKQQFIWTVVAQHITEFYKCIETYLKKYHTIADSDLLNDLVSFQKDIMINIDYDCDKGKIKNYKFNWYDYFYNEKQLLKQKQKVHYFDTHIGTLSERIPLKDPSLYMKYAAGGRSYFVQRQGSYIHQSIEVIK